MESRLPSFVIYSVRDKAEFLVILYMLRGEGYSFDNQFLNDDEDYTDCVIVYPGRSIDGNFSVLRKGEQYDNLSFLPPEKIYTAREFIQESNNKKFKQ